MVITNYSFANIKGIRSQSGFVDLVVDRHGSANGIHYGSMRCKRVTRSVMASELNPLKLGFGNVVVIRDVVWEALNR